MFQIYRLLSHASLPESNPLLELDDAMGEDFQKMLNEWDNHMGALQVNQSKLTKAFVRSPKTEWTRAPAQ